MLPAEGAKLLKCIRILSKEGSLYLIPREYESESVSTAQVQTALPYPSRILLK